MTTSTERPPRRIPGWAKAVGALAVVLAVLWPGGGQGREPHRQRGEGGAEDGEDEGLARRPVACSRAGGRAGRCTRASRVSNPTGLVRTNVLTTFHLSP